MINVLHKAWLFVLIFQQSGAWIGTYYDTQYGGDAWFCSTPAPDGAQILSFSHSAARIGWGLINQNTTASGIWFGIGSGKCNRGLFNADFQPTSLEFTFSCLDQSQTALRTIFYLVDSTPIPPSESFKCVRPDGKADTFENQELVTLDNGTIVDYSPNINGSIYASVSQYIPYFFESLSIGLYTTIQNVSAIHSFVNSIHIYQGEWYAEGYYGTEFTVEYAKDQMVNVWWSLGLSNVGFFADRINTDDYGFNPIEIHRMTSNASDRFLGLVSAIPTNGFEGVWSDLFFRGNASVCITNNVISFSSSLALVGYGVLTDSTHAYGNWYKLGADIEFPQQSPCVFGTFNLTLISDTILRFKQQCDGGPTIERDLELITSEQPHDWECARPSPNAHSPASKTLQNATRVWHFCAESQHVESSYIQDELQGRSAGVLYRVDALQGPLDPLINEITIYSGFYVDETQNYGVNLIVPFNSTYFLHYAWKGLLHNVTFAPEFQNISRPLKQLNRDYFTGFLVWTGNSSSDDCLRKLELERPCCVGGSNLNGGQMAGIIVGVIFGVFVVAIVAPILVMRLKANAAELN